MTTDHHYFVGMSKKVVVALFRSINFIQSHDFFFFMNNGAVLVILLYDRQSCFMPVNELWHLSNFISLDVNF